MENLREKIRQSNQLSLDEREILEALLTSSENGNIRESYEEVIGDGINSDYMIVHNMNNFNINITTQFTDSGEEVTLAWKKIDANRLLVSINNPMPVDYITVYINV